MTNYNRYDRFSLLLRVERENTTKKEGKKTIVTIAGQANRRTNRGELPSGCLLGGDFLLLRGFLKNLKAE